MVALSKGLCCPVGSLLLGSRERILRARSVRQLLGGGMRQAGVLAAAGLVGLRQMIPRLAADHESARRLERALQNRTGIRVGRVETNIVVARFEEPRVPALIDALKDRGVLAGAMDASTLRLVTHHDVSPEECERAAQALGETLD